MAKQIVFIHGMWGRGILWNKFQHYFEKKGYECHAPDLRYHDAEKASDPDPKLARTGLLDYVQDLESFIEGLDTRPVIIGHSMGGLLAQILSERGLADSAVLITPAAPMGIVTFNPVALKSFWGVFSKWGFWNRILPRNFEALASVLNQLSKDEQIKLYEQMVPESGRAFFEMTLWLLDPKNAAKVDENSINCRMLIVGGGRDVVTPVDMVRRTAEKYERIADYIEYPEHSHGIIWEKGWRNVAGDIEAWLSKAAHC